MKKHGKSVLFHFAAFQIVLYIGSHDILVGNSKQVNNFSKPYFFLDTLVTCNIPRQPNLIYLIICLIKLQEVVVFLSKTHSFMSRDLGTAGSKCICKHCQCLTWRQKKLLLPIHRDCQPKCPIISLFSLMNFS